ncbi:MAG: FecR family protein [Pirellulales bacterium]|nr:FecR family protein [Pirellulales bacterium]
MNADDALVRECAELVGALADRELSRPELARLEELVCNSPACCTYYVRFVQLNAGLRHYLAAAPAGDAHAAVAPGQDPPPAHRREPLPLQLPDAVWPPRGQWGAMLSCGLLLVALAVLSWAVRSADLKPSAPQVVVRPAPRSVARPEEEPLATVMPASTAQLVAEPGPVAAYRKLGLGRLLVAGGRLILLFRGGSLALIEGPAEVEIAAADRMIVNRGEVNLAVPRAAIGFTIDSAVARTVDLGTRFGVRVADGGQTDVQVYEGEVEVAPLQSSAAQKQRVKASRAVRLGAGRNAEWEVLRFVPQPRQAELLAGVAAAIPHWKTVFQDDFLDDALDVDRWSVVTAGLPGAPRITVEKGRAMLCDRGYLVTREEFDPYAGGVRISGRWRLGTAKDVLSVVTRSDAVPTGEYGHCHRGLEFGIVSGPGKNFIAILGHGDCQANYQSAPFELRVGDEIDFEIVDSHAGQMFRVRTTDGRAEAVLTAVAISSPGENHVVFHNRNRQRLPVVSELETVRIELPEARELRDPGLAP